MINQLFYTNSMCLSILSRWLVFFKTILKKNFILFLTMFWYKNPDSSQFECITLSIQQKKYRCLTVSYVVRLLRIHLVKLSMHLSSTSRTFSRHQLHFSSTPSMILTEMVQILFVDTPSVFVRVSPLLFLMACGSTSLIMMHLLSLSSLLRGTQGVWSIDEWEDLIRPSKCLWFN